MPLKYKFNEGMPGKIITTSEEPPLTSDESNVERYTEPGHLRWITFHDNNGKQSTQFYAWLGFINFDPQKQEMLLDFGKVKITIKGNNLQKLREEISAQRIKKVEPMNARYVQLFDKTAYIVTEVSFNKEKDKTK